MDKTKKSRVLQTVAAVSIMVVLILATYFIYVLTEYHRIDDMQALSAENKAGSTKPETEKEYSILTWNIGFGAYSDDFSFFMDGGKYSRAFSKDAATKNTSAMADRIKEEAPDIVVLQEVDVNGTRTYHVNEAELIAQTLDEYGSVFAQNYDSPFLFYPIFSPHGKNVSGIMTLSPFAATSALRRSLPIESGLRKLLDLDRCYSVTRFPTENGKELCIFNFHLSAYTADGTIATEQIKMMTSDMKAEYEKGNYVIGGGDFNKDLLGDSSQYFGVSCDDAVWAQPIPEGTIPDELTLVTSLNVPSCRNADRPYDETDFVVTVDGFLVSGNVEVTGIAVLDEKFAHSDHNPVKMTFKLK